MRLPAACGGTAGGDRLWHAGRRGGGRRRRFGAERRRGSGPDGVRAARRFGNGRPRLPAGVRHGGRGRGGAPLLALYAGKSGGEHAADRLPSWRKRQGRGAGAGRSGRGFPEVSANRGAERSAGVCADSPAASRAAQLERRCGFRIRPDPRNGLRPPDRRGERLAVGFQHGGTAVWEFAAQSPGLFARIAPISGSARAVLDRAPSLLETPVWAFVAPPIP